MRLGLIGPRRYRQPPVRVAPPPRVASPVAARPQVTRATSIPYYSQSRIFKDIKVVKDMRQSGTERGETQSGDSGTLGPGSIAPPQTGVATNGKLVAPQNNLIPLALAAAAFILFRG